MGVRIIDEYPSGAAFRSCYVSRAARGEVIETVRGEPTVRPERIVDTGVDVEMEGTLCLGERTVRHLAALLGMVDGWRAEDLRVALAATEIERDGLSAKLATALDRMRTMQRARRAEPAKVYVDIEGNVHASKDAAASSSRRLLHVEHRAGQTLTPMRAADHPLPTEVPA